MPYDPSVKEVTQHVVFVSERQLTILDAIKDALSVSPAVVALGASITKQSAARSVFESGLIAKADELGIDIDAVLAREQAAYDEWVAVEGNAQAAAKFRAD